MLSRSQRGALRCSAVVPRVVGSCAVSALRAPQLCRCHRGVGGRLALSPPFRPLDSSNSKVNFCFVLFFVPLRCPAPPLLLLPPFPVFRRLQRPCGRSSKAKPNPNHPVCRCVTLMKAHESRVSSLLDHGSLSLKGRKSFLGSSPEKEAGRSGRRVEGAGVVVGGTLRCYRMDLGVTGQGVQVGAAWRLSGRDHPRGGRQRTKK